MKDALATIVLLAIVVAFVAASIELRVGGGPF